jgi:hypothetical protein
MNGPVAKGVIKTLPKRQHRRTVATTVDLCLPPVRWSPDLINQVASLLADALVRDVQERPPEKPRIAS